MLAPNFSSWTAPTKAMIRPTRKLIRVTMGSASGPLSCSTRRTSRHWKIAVPRRKRPNDSVASPRNRVASRVPSQASCAAAPTRASHERRRVPRERRSSRAPRSRGRGGAAIHRAGPRAGPRSAAPWQSVAMRSSTASPELSQEVSPVVSKAIARGGGVAASASLDRRRRREPGAQMPLPGELHHQGVAVAARGHSVAVTGAIGSRGPNGHVVRLTTTARASRSSG